MGFLDNKRAKKQADQQSFNQKMAARPGLPEQAYAGMVQNQPETRAIVAANSSAPLSVLQFLAGLGDPEIASALESNDAWLSRPQLPPPPTTHD